jgi:hypothetical protein
MGSAIGTEKRCKLKKRNKNEKEKKKEFSYNLQVERFQGQPLDLPFLLWPLNHISYQKEKHQNFNISKIFGLHLYEVIIIQNKLKFFC